MQRNKSLAHRLLSSGFTCSYSLEETCEKEPTRTGYQLGLDWRMGTGVGWGGGQWSRCLSLGNELVLGGGGDKPSYFRQCFPG